VAVKLELPDTGGERDRYKVGVGALGVSQKAIEELQKNQTKLHASAGDKVAALAESAKKLAEAKKSLEAAYPEVDDKGRRFRRKKPGERFIPFGKGSPSNNASSFSVVIH